MEIIAVSNQKGGVGKTTTAVNLSVYLGKMGKKVLIVDMDPQGNASASLLRDKEVKSYLYNSLIDHSLFNPILTDNQNVMVIPTDQNLVGLELELANSKQAYVKLKQLLTQKANYFDYIIIDCPPSLGLLTVNALVAADSVLVPVQSEYFALEGLTQLLSTIKQVKTGLNKDLVLLGVVLTMYDKRMTLSNNVYQEVQKHFGSKLFNTIVPRNVRLAEAPSFGKSIAQYDRFSKGARAYKQLAKEVVSRAK